MAFRGKKCSLIILLTAAPFILNVAEALVINNVTCSGSDLLDIRIDGCKEQPCRIKKGEPLPFQIDLSFARPRDFADDVYFNIYVPNYARTPVLAKKGTTLLTATCEQGNLGFPCPMNAGVPYTLKSSLLIDTRSKCTANCEQMGPNGTGLRESKWRWTISNSRKISKLVSQKQISRANRGRLYSVCHFSVMLNIVDE